MDDESRLLIEELARQDGARRVAGTAVAPLAAPVAAPRAPSSGRDPVRLWREHYGPAAWFPQPDEVHVSYLFSLAHAHLIH